MAFWPMHKNDTNQSALNHSYGLGNLGAALGGSFLGNLQQAYDERFSQKLFASAYAVSTYPTSRDLRDAFDRLNKWGTRLDCDYASYFHELKSEIEAWVRGAVRL